MVPPEIVVLSFSFNAAPDATSIPAAALLF
jgi:hypothetical protein